MQERWYLASARGPSEGGPLVVCDTHQACLERVCGVACQVRADSSRKRSWPSGTHAEECGAGHKGAQIAVGQLLPCES